VSGSGYSWLMMVYQCDSDNDRLDDRDSDRLDDWLIMIVIG
jgi:hypothetical protein